MLGHALPRNELIAGLLAYRAVYYLVPLALALLVYLRLESAAPAGEARRSGPGDA
jgi:uncharacterized membrane protein YbhN (UPF0104 family)